MEEFQIPQSKKKKERLIIEGKYKLVKKISQGGFGKVYTIEDLITKKHYVIKVNAEIKMNDSEYEISKMLSDLKLYGFPKVYSQGVIQDQPSCAAPGMETSWHHVAQSFPSLPTKLDAIFL